MNFRLMLSTLFARPRADRCEKMVDSGAEITFNFKPEDGVLYIAMTVNRQSNCSLVARQPSTASQEKLQAWREVDRRDVFKDFERKHAAKFAFLAEEQKIKPKDWLQFRPKEPLSDEEQLKWKNKYMDLKTRQDKKLRLFQKLSNFKNTDYDQIEKLDEKPFLMEILKLVNNGILAKQKKEEIEMTGMQKSRYDFEKKKLYRQIKNYFKEIFTRRKYVEMWSKEFVIMIAFVSIIQQVHARFLYLKAFRDRCRKKMVATLFAVSRVKFSMESRGPTMEDRTATESKM